jgi:hypothetical protein
MKLISRLSASLQRDMQEMSFGDHLFDLVNNPMSVWHCED